MTVHGPTELISALESGEFASVEGTPEGDWVDFKRTPYEVEATKPLRLTPKGRWELCKDVAAFANAAGGCIVIGFPEKPDPTLGVNVAGPAVLIEVSSVDLDHYGDVLQAGTYPPPRRVEMKWYAHDDPPRGVLLINVGVTRGEQPHVLRRVVNTEGEIVEGVGVPTRIADRTNWHSAERVHHLLQTAEQLIGQVPLQGPSVEILRRADDLLTAILTTQGWDDEAVHILQAVPIGGTPKLPNFYDEMRELINNPPSLRPMGFNLRGLTGDVEVISGALVARRAGDGLMWLTPDGTFVVAVLAVPSYLGWAMNKDGADIMRINSTVLVELTLEFCRFVAGQLNPRLNPSDWRYRVECRQFKTRNVHLAPGPPPKFPFQGSLRPASDDDWRREVPGTGDPEVDAFELLSEVYALFGLPEDAIPYSEDRRVLSVVVQEL
jgi:hypothetical protein